MRLYRFCSQREVALLLKNGEIHSDTDHYRGGAGGSTSRGFCLTADAPEDAWRYLKGIVTPEVCVTYDIPDKLLTRSEGVYCNNLYSSAGEYCPERMLKEEWCIPRLSVGWLKEVTPLEAFVPDYELEAVRMVEMLKTKYNNSKHEKI